MTRASVGNETCFPTVHRSSPAEISLCVLCFSVSTSTMRDFISLVRRFTAPRRISTCLAVVDMLRESSLMVVVVWESKLDFCRSCVPESRHSVNSCLQSSRTRDGYDNLIEVNNYSHTRYPICIQKHSSMSSYCCCCCCYYYCFPCYFPSRTFQR
jgi:hypothetical protein